MKKAFRVLLIFFLLIFILLNVLWYMTSDRDVYTQVNKETTGRTVTYILIDGLSQSIFQEELAKGKFPNIQKLISGGTYIKNGIGSFPSMTGYAFYPFMTGMDAPKSNILGLRWFDRSLDRGNLRNYVGRANIFMNKDVTNKYINVFEAYKEEYTSSINTFMNPGVKHHELTGWPFTTAKFNHLGIFKVLSSIPFYGDKLTHSPQGHETMVNEMAIQQLQRNPKVQWVSYGCPDANHHIHGTDQTYFDLLYHIDALIGEFRAEVERLGQQDQRAIAIITDHGIWDVDKNLDIRKNLLMKYGIDIERGSSTTILSPNLEDELSGFEEKDGYFVINGNLSAYIYMKDPYGKGKEAWRENLSYEILTNYPVSDGHIHLPNTIAQMEGVSLVAFKKSDTEVQVVSAEGMATITKKEDQFAYEVEGIDPLKYNLEMLDTLIQYGNANEDNWLKVTSDSAYPYGAVRLFELMQHPRVGDMVICSAKGYDLAADYEILVGNYKGGHGGLHRDLLNVPYIMYFPNAKPQKVRVARAEDVGASIMQYLGIETDYPLDGNSLLDSNLVVDSQGQQSNF